VLLLRILTDPSPSKKPAHQSIFGSNSLFTFFIPYGFLRVVPLFLGYSLIRTRTVRRGFPAYSVIFLYVLYTKAMVNLLEQELRALPRYSEPVL